jgi:hypothetical protein
VANYVCGLGEIINKCAETDTKKDISIYLTSEFFITCGDFSEVVEEFRVLMMKCMILMTFFNDRKAIFTYFSG